MSIFTTSMKYFVLILFVLLGAVRARSQVIFDGKKNTIAIGSAIKYYPDPPSSQDINSIQKQTHFVSSKENVPDFGLLKTPVWLKISITNKSATPDLMIDFDQSFLQNIDFYYLDSGKYKVNQSGESRPFKSRLVNYHKFVYDVKIPIGATAIYYVRIRSILEMQMPIFLGKKDAVVENNLNKNILFGLFFGIILVMFFYNLFIYFVLKDPIYLYYVVYILVVGLVQTTIEGYCFQYLWPGNSFLATRSFFFLTALVNITGLEFIRNFLRTKEFVPRLDKVCYFFYAVYGIDMILTLKGDFFLSYHIIQSFASLVSIYILTVCVIIARRGYRPAKFFIIAWIPLISGIIVWILKDLNVLPYNTFTNYSITFGSALEVILLSFALADKINIFKAEKEKSQEETLNALKENERMVREQNVDLELKVNVRTIELNELNLALTGTLEDLKQTQTMLVESEKMASLGQLTAGIAHEINNPINFVTSNINPLKRDVEILFEALAVFEQVSISDFSLPEKQKQIKDYKDEMDFDYLTMEIKQLIKGINEGASRTAEIVKGLKIFSRLDEDDLKKANINEGLDSTMIIANNLLDNKIKIVKEYGDLPKIECYAGKLNQVFLNIISNAVFAVRKKFGANAGGQITLITTHDEKNVYITIRDNGTGMNAQTQKKLFEPFFTTKDVGEGTGLGMSIAYNTIKKHNGSISVHSIPGEGTGFILQIPIIFTEG